ncbi:MAG: hypothetical protein A2186_03815 [Candidatus Levybacteria bacterium RIFOXYA1_FULL_41_10]|nr:MAG: hypothetical protein UT44_C0025G0004 [Candidatus Levybacteria bacterium GW2011_GWA1_39_32]KKR50850.1 MAG: hypothetical protein UT87_C0011G0028 [Candidatus Levybacteria bacterium GW2011_GWC1_40_19]KKR95247.1 MAG: hypothetical protein UU45_C0003G0033 [Candidatus Levybacteria bacterium GW2011_GWA2_41_15]KKS00369.1 MAG: hypothetical protein UU52_C0035G0008 [Candidatus Levybacteria bacterium GW2011_GWB1_41_21]OGH20964.1 MAG: hypothetical protein A2695_00955 [Candidatus Levybacteria bacterium
MARTSKRKESKNSKTPINQDILTKLGLNQSYVSLALGIAVVLIIGFLALFFLRDKNGLQNVSIRDILTGDRDAQDEQVDNAPKEYIVKDGDNLWMIAENHYKSGYNWIDIAKANNLTDPNLIEAGQKLNIPQNVKVIIPLGQGQALIAGTSYTTVDGDTLWDISVRAYGDGYKWVEVADFNKLPNPDIIPVGTVLSIPR